MKGPDPHHKILKKQPEKRWNYQIKYPTNIIWNSDVTTFLALWWLLSQNHGWYMGLPWISHGFPWDFHGISRELNSRPRCRFTALRGVARNYVVSNFHTSGPVSEVSELLRSWSLGMMTFPTRMVYGTYNAPGWWLSLPLWKNMSSSVGMMTFPI